MTEKSESDDSSNPTGSNVTAQSLLDSLRSRIPQMNANTIANRQKIMASRGGLGVVGTFRPVSNSSSNSSSKKAHIMAMMGGMAATPQSAQPVQSHSEGISLSDWFFYLQEISKDVHGTATEFFTGVVGHSQHVKWLYCTYAALHSASRDEMVLMNYSKNLVDSSGIEKASRDDHFYIEIDHNYSEMDNVLLFTNRETANHFNQWRADLEARFGFNALESSVPMLKTGEQNKSYLEKRDTQSSNNNQSTTFFTTWVWMIQNFTGKVSFYGSSAHSSLLLAIEDSVDHTLFRLTKPYETFTSVADVWQ